MSIESKLSYLFDTKEEIREAIQEKGVSVPSSTTFRAYADKIREIETGSAIPPEIELNLQEKTADPTGQEFEVYPDADYDALSKVIVTGEPNLKPENIAEGITIYGVTGTMQLKTSVGGNIPSAYQGYFEQARLLYPGDYEDLMILESDQAVSFGFMLDGFTVKSYNKTNTEFTASNWVYVAYNKKTGVWKLEDWSNSTSNGNSYINNIRYCSTPIYYNGQLIYPYVNSAPGEDHLEMSFEIMPAGPRVYYLGVYGYDIRVSWGDGTESAFDTTNPYSSIVHKYEDADGSTTYTITISGYVTQLILSSSGSSSSWTKMSGIVTRFLTPLSSSLVSVNGLLYDNSLVTSIPENLFEYCGELLANIANCFDNSHTLRTIPTGLFDPLVNLVRADYLFRNSTALRTVPNGLFVHSPNLNHFEHAFEYSGITTIPKNMLSNKVEGLRMESSFAGCLALTSISTGLLEEMMDAPGERFSSIIRLAENCTSIYTSIPPIWENDSLAEVPHSMAFSSCHNAANYANIPSDWR